MNIEKTKTSISFFINGEKYKTNSKINIEILLKFFNINETIVIIEYNKCILLKKNWSKKFLKNFDRIEILSIVGGG